MCLVNLYLKEAWRGLHLKSVMDTDTESAAFVLIALGLFSEPVCVFILENYAISLIYRVMFDW